MTEDRIGQAAQAIAARLDGGFPKIVLVLGSGLGPYADGLTDAVVIPYGEIPGFPVSTVAGHSGRLVIGRAAGAPIACMQGRMHLYEGHAASELALPVRTFKRLGAEILMLTNAAGSLKREMDAGSIMIVEDHINLTGRNPLIGPNDESIGPRFFDMSQAYDPALRQGLRAAADAVGVPVGSGVYVQVPGPNFETPAEIRAFRILGGDAVGMSTVPETLTARHCGLRVAALSLITNLGAGLADHALSHEETIGEAAKAFDGVSRVLTRFFQDLETTA
jgi:inosine/guanosine/xanthosine phosphorylase family protein